MKGYKMKNKNILNAVILIVCGAAITICYFLFIFPLENTNTLTSVLYIVALVIGCLMVIAGTVMICVKKSGQKTHRPRAVVSSHKDCEICGAHCEPDANGCCKYCGGKLSV